MTKMEYTEKVTDIMPYCIGVRRALHRMPELSFEEYETTDFLIKELSQMPELELVRPFRTGVMAVLHGGAGSGRRILIRADIDALPITEETGLDFSSEKPGVMHACGHDGHTAMLLGALKLLYEERAELTGEVRFLFQHAEELPPGGAADWEKAGIMEGVNELYGLHLSSTFPTGTFGVRSGALTSATDRFDIRVIGRGGHSAYPETCTDPVVMAAQVILGLQTIVSRSIKAVEPAVVSVCMVHAGDAYNIIPGEVLLTGSVRTFDPETRRNMPSMIKRITEGICSAAGGSCEVRYEEGYASVINDAQLTAKTRGLIESVFGKDAVLEIDPLMPGEDYSALQGHCPGFFVELGARCEEKGCTVPHHNAHYLMDEDALQNGVEYYYRLVHDRCGSGKC